MLIRKSANTRPAAKLITSSYRKTSGRGWGRAGISLWLHGPQCTVKINRPRFKSLVAGKLRLEWSFSLLCATREFSPRCSELFFTFKIRAIERKEWYGTYFFTFQRIKVWKKFFNVNKCSAFFHVILLYYERDKRISEREASVDRYVCVWVLHYSEISFSCF